MGVVAVAQALHRVACLDISMCNKVSEMGLKALSVGCRALLKLVSLPFGSKPKLSSIVFAWLKCFHCIQDVCGCSLLSRQAIGNASALLADCAIKSSLSDENSLRHRVERFGFFFVPAL